MSGTEIADTIEKETDGRWRPRPGSIYPLLKSFLAQGLIREVPSEDNRTRRYALTPRGEELYDQQIVRSEQIQEKLGVSALQFLPPPFMLGFIGDAAALRGSLHRLLAIFFELRHIIQVDDSGDALESVARLLEETADRFEQVLGKLKKQLAVDRR